MAIQFKTIWAAWLTIAFVGNTALFCIPNEPAPEPTKLDPAQNTVLPVPAKSPPEAIQVVEIKPTPEVPKRTNPTPMMEAKQPESGYILRKGTENGTVLILVIAQDYSNDSTRFADLKKELKDTETSISSNLLGGTIFVLDRSGLHERESWFAKVNFSQAFSREEFQEPLVQAKKQLAMLLKQSRRDQQDAPTLPMLIWDSNFNPDREVPKPESTPWNPMKDGPIPIFFRVHDDSSDVLNGIFGTHLTQLNLRKLNELSGTVIENYQVWTKTTKGR